MDETNHDVEGSLLESASSLRLVRLRLRLALVTMFLIPLAIATPAIYGLYARRGEGLLTATALISVLALILGLLTVWLAHRVLEPAERLEAARAWLTTAFERAQAEALLDPLTGLGNHRAFQDELDRHLALALRHNHPLALVMLDLDDFKQINDSRGHAAGDTLLAAAARLMTGTLRRSDRAFRIGGDEFALLLPMTDGDGASLLARRLLAMALEQRRADRPAFSFTAGIAVAGAVARTRDDLYQQADAALYWGKRHGRTCVTVFDVQRHVALGGDRPTAELAAAISRVAETRALRAVFQPIYSLTTGEPTGFEGLIRPRPETGFADPGSMFEAAETSGKTLELDLACVSVVVAAAARLGLPGDLNINLSPRSLEADEFSVTSLLGIVTSHGLSPHRIVIEITERETIEDLSRVDRVVRRLRDAGIRIAADDVGAGNAGLRLLSQIRFDIVKVDLSLVQGGAVRESALEVVRSLNDLASRWHATVIAEGVEEPAQLQMLRSLGIEAGQGYLLGRPTEQPSTERLDLKGFLPATDWLTARLARQPA